MKRSWTSMILAIVGMYGGALVVCIGFNASTKTTVCVELAVLALNLFVASASR